MLLTLHTIVLLFTFRHLRPAEKLGPEDETDKTQSFVDGFDNLLLLQHTSSEQGFDVVLMSIYNMKRRLVVDSAAAREAYKKWKLYNIALIHCSDFIADAMTKVKSN